MYNSQIQWYKNTQELAKVHHSGGRYNIVALLVKGNKIVSVGYNYYPDRRGGSTIHISYDLTGVHAEAAAIINNMYHSSTLFIAGYNENGKEICTLPCRRCINLIQKSQVKVVVCNTFAHILTAIKRKDLL
jgi:deoxycytidylate deaminase